MLSKPSPICSSISNWQTWQKFQFFFYNSQLEKQLSRFLKMLNYSFDLFAAEIEKYKHLLYIKYQQYSVVIFTTWWRLLLIGVHAFQYCTCWDLLKRWISSMNRMVFLLHSRSSFCACFITSRTSLMDALVADRETNRAVPFFLLVLAIMWARVVWNTSKHTQN